MKLFCIPYAGGSATYYSRWRSYLSKEIKLIPLELSGRGARFGEPLYSSFQDAVDDLYECMIKRLDDREPYAIFGHSMGALIAYELYLKLKENQKHLPIHIFFSGREAPHTNLFGSSKGHINHLPDNQFLEELKKYNGLTEEFLNNSELIELFMPIIRADFFIVENYQYKPDREKLNCSITILNGSQDYITKAGVQAWEKYTKCTCDVVNFEGSHFFVEQNLDKVIDLIQHRLKIH
ncbi:Surfactin synthase thioesterase subunit [Paenibacillus sophorae]|uniref:Surfactin synthase thioesterase subunit n=1 Tax=Paenibacillus sophorae TaxID=1333845 RepID=A0A1H8PPF6_9BACL|nr:alpha/beta fold hydrolase [Paenibacillus sophorae]QWU16642.1 thioesterase II family protein [Paenibacillus sophorae]SEO43597.1 Surfactin synthase thioesterase subunit [Paenibacillus sophorae]